jgi:hypothetical protein
MIVIKDVPGLTPREVLEALLDITGPAASVATGHGGFVVDEDVAERFLSAYLIAIGKRPAPTVAAAVTTKPTTQAESVTSPNAPTGSGPARTTTRRAGKRKGAV